MWKGDCPNCKGPVYKIDLDLGLDMQQYDPGGPTFIMSPCGCSARRSDNAELYNEMRELVHSAVQKYAPEA